MVAPNYSDGNILYAGSLNIHFYNVLGSTSALIQSSGAQTGIPASASGSVLLLTISGPLNLLDFSFSGTFQGDTGQPRLTVMNGAIAWYSGLINNYPNPSIGFPRVVTVNRYSVGSITFWGAMSAGTNTGGCIVLANYV